jgi:peptide chain release factor 2
VGELKALNAILKPLNELAKSSEEIETLVEMGQEDESLAAELPGELDRAERMLDEFELQSLLSGPLDSAGALMTINARDGGTDANDWAEMLLRMYIQWANDHDFSTEILDRVDDMQAGIQSASLAIRGPMAYGYLKGETGMHRLVRISPFNAEGKRHTSFAAIDVSPEVSDAIEIDLDPEDIREDVFRASGAGGQHVNKTSSAIRMTHIPKMLLSRLMRLEEEKREAQQAAKYEGQAKTGFGSQIRSYFQHPDQRVKDERTGYKETNFQYVLDGHIQPFLDSYLRWRVGAEEPAS